ncbi:MAG: hypothetical protein ACE5EE_08190 [Fidelibacterota bacterium]
MKIKFRENVSVENTAIPLPENPFGWFIVIAGTAGDLWVRLTLLG